MNFYEKIYTGLFKLLFTKVDVGEYSASILLSVFIMANLISVLGFLEINEVVNVQLQRSHGMIGMIPILVFNFLYFNSRGRHKSLVKKASKEIDSVYAFTIVYVLVSLVIFFYIASLNKNNLNKVFP